MSDHWIVSINDAASAWTPVIWRATWQGGLFVFAVWLTCKLFRSMPPSAKSWLWWIASLQLLIRFAVVSSFDLPILPAHATTATSGFSAQALPDLPTTAVEIPISTTDSPRILVKEAPLYTKPAVPYIPLALTGAPKQRFSIESMAFGLWVLGVCACIGISIRRLVAAGRLLRNATPVTFGPSFDLAQEFSIDYGIPMPRMLTSEEALCPLLTGWRRPAIVLPRGSIEEFNDSELRMAIAHEFAHLKRKDLWLGIGPAITQSLFFFHPLAWLATHEGAAAREAACDSEALRMSGSTPAAYARLLIDSAQARSSMAVLGTAFGYRLIQRRISMLKSVAGANARRYRTACTAIIALGAVCALPWSVTAQSVAPPKPTAHKPAKKTSKMHKVAVKGHVTSRSLVGLAPRQAFPPRMALGMALVPPTPAALPPRAPNAVLAAPPAPGLSGQPGLGAAIAPPAPAASLSRSVQRVLSKPSAAPRTPAAGAANVPVLGDLPIVGRLFQSRTPATRPQPVGGRGRNSDGGGFGGGSEIPAIAPSGVGIGGGGFAGGDGISAPVGTGTALGGGAMVGSARVTNQGSGRSEVTMNGELVNVRFEHVDIHTAIKQLFDATESSYMIKSDVESDKVTCSLRNVTREQALSTILSAVKQPLTFRIEGGVTTIFIKQ